MNNSEDSSGCAAAIAVIGGIGVFVGLGMLVVAFLGWATSNPAWVTNLAVTGLIIAAISIAICILGIAAESLSGGHSSSTSSSSTSSSYRDITAINIPERHQAPQPSLREEMMKESTKQAQRERDAEFYADHGYSSSSPVYFPDLRNTRAYDDLQAKEGLARKLDDMDRRNAEIKAKREADAKYRAEKKHK